MPFETKTRTSVPCAAPSGVDSKTNPTVVATIAAKIKRTLIGLIYMESHRSSNLIAKDSFKFGRAAIWIMHKPRAEPIRPRFSYPAGATVAVAMRHWRMPSRRSSSSVQERWCGNRWAFWRGHVVLSPLRNRLRRFTCESHPGIAHFQNSIEFRRATGV